MSADNGKTVLKRIAAIDLGTNSFHMVIVDIYSDGSFYTVDKLKEMVLLAEKGIGDRLSKAAMDRGIDALKKMQTLCDHQSAGQILAYATSAIREAENGGDFIQRAIDEVGIKINAISGRMEADMIGYAIRHSVHLGDETALMMDIGGGSVEFLLGNRDLTPFLTSKKLGVARMAAAFVSTDPVSKKEITNLREHFTLKLQDVAEAVKNNPPSLLIGSSGTMENIAQIITGIQGDKPSLSLNELEFTDTQFFDLYDRVVQMKRKQRSKLKGLDEKRVDLIVPGLLLVDCVLRMFNIDRIKISDQALREGIVLRYINKEMHEFDANIDDMDPRRRSVSELLRRCDWHADHSSHVAGMSLRIFDALQTELGLPDDDRELLEFAALMHDIGYHISHRRHHQHALYLIRNADLKGFRELEIEIMANVARYHRRSTPKKRHKRYRRLSDDAKDRISKLSGILRVADGLDRSHYQNIQQLTLSLTDENIYLDIESEEDPQLEIWGAMRKKQLFEKVTGRKLVIREIAEDHSDSSHS